jgi:GNAT superfamily N-acetyltransferase
MKREYKYSVSQAKVMHWPQLVELAKQAEQDPNSSPVRIDVDHLEKYLINANAHPGMIGFFVLWQWADDDWKQTPTAAGVVTTCLLASPQMLEIGMPPVRHCFIQGAYVAGVSARGIRVSYSAGKMLMEEVEKWARERQCSNICANVRNDGPVDGFCRKYGFERWHHVIGKAVT